jgi:hypothetical protein
MISTATSAVISGGVIMKGIKATTLFHPTHECPCLLTLALQGGIVQSYIEVGAATVQKPWIPLLMMWIWTTNQYYGGFRRVYASKEIPATLHSTII